LSLTSGRGPLSSRPAGRLVPPLEAPATYLEPFRRRVRGLVRGVVRADSDAVVLVHRPDRPPCYAFPAADAAGLPAEPLAELAGYVTVPWDAVDSWLEEDEAVVMHPRNPYHRVDCLRSSRRLRVEAGGELVVDTDRTMAVFETSLDPRLYVERRELRPGARLEPSPTRTFCRYKGDASYWNLRVGELEVLDAAWSYESALSESAAISGLVCFDDTRVTVVTSLPPALDLAGPHPTSGRG
jgi:uncharacterized protein (DUF427 family)